MGTVSRLPAQASLDATLPQIDDVESLMRQLTGADETSVTGQACDHHLVSGGGRTRAQLALSVGQCLSLNQRHCVAIAAAAELIHNASLIHDDIQDRSPIRRGRAALWQAFGPDVALVIGDLFLSASYAALQPLLADSADSALLVARVHQAIHRTIRGQNQELTLSTQHCSLPRYETIVGGKSGPLLSLPVELVLIATDLATLVPNVEAGMKKLATTYQILDDLEDVGTDLASKDAEQHCLNIIGQLRIQQVSDPHEQARELAKLRLEEARQRFSVLPQGCQNVLDGLIERLAAKLERR
ncbi:polyprenyl synthetase family protein [Wenzhouxiangella sp. EGI_FJ10409]|uniref:polyprenyl synthetase family protein n=1 Tax=Wenzhouxiangella sp. EGI_FJ10409 TaxID=3243767 RepID=UPI0035DB8CAD